MTQTKICTRCKKDQPLSEFSKKARHKDGLSYYCKLCEAVEFKKYRDNTPEHNQNSIAANKRLNELTLKTATHNNQQWLKEEDDLLREFYLTETAVTIGQTLGRSFSAINNRARVLGLRKRADSRLSEALMSE